MGNYDDIINLPNYRPRKHPALTMESRAAQFAPFAALTGHGAAIEETARLTDSWIDMDEDSKQELDRRMALLLAHLSDEPFVEITHFVKDKRKQGGAYSHTTGTIRKWDEPNQQFTMENGETIDATTIIALEGKFFEQAD